MFWTVAEEWQTDTRHRRKVGIVDSAGTTWPWVLVGAIRRLVIRIWVERDLTKAIVTVRWDVGLPAEPNSRYGPRVNSTQARTWRAGPPCVRAASGTCGSNHDSRIAHRVVVIRTDESLPPQPMFCQSCCNRCVVVAPAVFPSSAKEKYDKERDRSSGESHDHEDASYSPFVLEEALDKRDSQD
jgi:hypothetical protein